jgi:hypothetical protein
MDRATLDTNFVPRVNQCGEVLYAVSVDYDRT